MAILTYTQVTRYKLLIIIFDKLQNVITIVVVGKTSQESLHSVELNLKTKNFCFGFVINIQLKIVYIIFSYIGRIATRYYNNYLKTFEEDKYVESYI